MGTREEIQSRMARDTELSKERQANAKRSMKTRRASQARAKKLKALADPDSRQYHKGKNVDTSKYSERRKTPVRTGPKNVALDKARTQGRIQPRPPGHPNYQGAGPRVPKNTVAKSLTKGGKGVKDLFNSLSWRAGDLSRKASQTGVGKALTKFAGSGVGRVAAKVASKVAGPAIAVGIVADAYAITNAAVEGGRAIAAQSQARHEKAGSEAKYGTVARATATRHAKARKKDVKKKIVNSNLKTGYKLP